MKQGGKKGGREARQGARKPGGRKDGRGVCLCVDASNPAAQEESSACLRDDQDFRYLREGKTSTRHQRFNTTRNKDGCAQSGASSSSSDRDEHTYTS